MRSFHHNADGLIIIQNDAETYIDTVENFKIDSNTEYVGLPNDRIGRYYDPQKTHYFYTSDTAYPLSLQWDDGDNYIANVGNFIKAKTAREKLEIGFCQN